MNPADTARDDALTPDVWEPVERRLPTKMLENFTNEEILTSRPTEAGEDRSTYRVDLGDEASPFEATERLMDSLHVHGETVDDR